MAKISDFLISLVIVSLFMVLFSSVFIDVNDKYTIQDANSINLTKYNQLNNLNAFTNQIKGNLTNIKQSTGLTDILGGFFGAGYQVLLLVGNSVGTFQEMVKYAIADSPLGSIGGYLQIAIIAIVVIIIFIGILLSAIIKREL